MFLGVPAEACGLRQPPELAVPGRIPLSPGHSSLRPRSVELARSPQSPQPPTLRINGLRADESSGWIEGIGRYPLGRTTASDHCLAGAHPCAFQPKPRWRRQKASGTSSAPRRPNHWGCVGNAPPNAATRQARAANANPQSSPCRQATSAVAKAYGNIERTGDPPKRLHARTTDSTPSAASMLRDKPFCTSDERVMSI